MTEWVMWDVFMETTSDNRSLLGQTVAKNVMTDNFMKI